MTEPYLNKTCPLSWAYLGHPLWFALSHRLKNSAEVVDKFMELNGGQYWDRTSDPYDVNVVLYR
jgi:hypothetical protein